MNCEALVRRALTAIERGDGAALRALVTDDVEWNLGAGEGEPRRWTADAVAGFPVHLRARRDEREVKEIALVGDAVVARLEGDIQAEDFTQSGTVYYAYFCRDGLIAARRDFYYRKELIRALGLSRKEAEGVLVVGSDDDARLFHFDIERGSQIVWASYDERGDSDHDHCGICWDTFCAEDDDDQHEGYTTLDGSSWLCPECFDEVKDHFELQVVRHP